MMVTHWESSRRPLFVKTVWKDGQHHVVLHKEEEQSEPPKSRRNITSGSSQTSTSRISKQPNGCSNFKVASVKLLLSGVKKFKDGPQIPKTPIKHQSNSSSSPNTLTIQITPNESLKYRNLNRDVTFSSYNSSAQQKKYFSKSRSIEISEDNCHDNLDEIRPQLIQKYTSSNFNNTLSERVMIWLDLATQNGDFNKELNNNKQMNTTIPKRVVTAHSCSVTKPLLNLSKKRSYSSNYYSGRFEQDIIDEIPCEENIKIEGTSQILQITNQSILKDESNKENMVVPNGNGKVFQPHLSSHVEEDVVVENVQEINTKNRISTAKRQLHIFIPNIPKNSECDSILSSSKCSSLYYKNLNENVI